MCNDVTSYLMVLLRHHLRMSQRGFAHLQRKVNTLKKLDREVEGPFQSFRDQLILRVLFLFYMMLMINQIMMSKYSEVY